MKKTMYLMLFFITAFCFLTLTERTEAANAVDYISVLQNISDTCEHGRQLIFRDTNGDGVYDKLRKTNCDGTYTETPMSVSGDGSFGRIGAHAQVISGDIDSEAYYIRIYFPSDNSTLGYLQKVPGDNPIFTFSGH